MEALHAELVVFLRLQKELVGKFEEAGRPRRGTLSTDVGTWQFFVHGAGVAFTDANSRVLVDVHDLHETTEEAFETFDVERIARYLGSLRRRGVKLAERAAGKRGAPLHDLVETALVRMVESGLLVAVGRKFKLIARAHS